MDIQKEILVEVALTGLIYFEMYGYILDFTFFLVIDEAYAKISKTSYKLPKFHE